MPESGNFGEKAIVLSLPTVLLAFDKANRVVLLLLNQSLITRGGIGRSQKVAVLNLQLEMDSTDANQIEAEECHHNLEW